MKKLSSKRQTAGNREYWWYNLSSPDDWIDNVSLIRLIVNGENDADTLGFVDLPLGKDSEWRSHILKASSHLYNNRKIIKVHLFKQFGSKDYKLYFGRVNDGLYSVKFKK